MIKWKLGLLQAATINQTLLSVVSHD